MPFFSIIVPIFNVEKYLIQCLDSLIHQTFDDIEIILVNDGSTDSSPIIAQEYANKDSRIKLITQENQGLSIARNNALKMGGGEYVLFVDSDDYIAITLCEKLHEILSKQPVDVLKYEILNPNPHYSLSLIPTPNPILGKQYLLTHPRCLETGCVWLFAISRKYLNKYHIIFIPKIIFEDMTFIAEIFYYAKTVFITHLPAYYYRIRDDSIMTSKLTPQKIQLCIKSYTTIANFFANLAQKEENMQLKAIFNKQIPAYYHHSIIKSRNNLYLIFQSYRNFKHLFQNAFPRKNHIYFLIKPYLILLKSAIKSSLFPIYRFIKTKIKRNTPQ